MSTTDPQALRDDLVEQVQRNVGVISSPVADALRSVPRHLFLPEVPPEVAYSDDAIITKRDEDGQPISSSSQPAIMALMLDQLGLAPGQRVLEIGAGTGYNAALMSRLVSPGGAVVSVDIDADLVDRARCSLVRAGCPGVDVVCVDGADGYPSGGPYDRIIATVGVWDLAPSWLDQLAPGGRLVVPLDLRGPQRSVAFEQEGGHWVSRSVVPCGFMRLRGSLAGPERTRPLTADGTLSINLPSGGTLDSAGVLTALDGPHSVRNTGVATRVGQIFTDLGLWLAIHEPSWCMLSESESATRPRLSSAPLLVTRSRMTAGLLGVGGIALLAVLPGEEPEREMCVHGYGAAGEALADRLAARVTAWDSAGRPGADLRITAYPKPGRDDDPVEGIVVDKTHHRLVIRWSAADDRDAG